jgi:hypothetical protein
MSIDRYHINRFNKNILKFLIVSTFIYVAIFEFSLHKLGETGDYEKIIIDQIEQNLLLGRKFTDLTLEYKIIGAQIIKPEVLILGTSRIMQIRQAFFKSKIIYNAGIDASTSNGLIGMKDFLDAVVDSTNIKHIIIGLDPWLFNPNYPRNKTEGLRYNIKKLLSNFPLLYKSLKKIKYYISIVTNRPGVYQKLIFENQLSLQYLLKDRGFGGYGLNSKMHNSGFRSDGSYQYPPDYQESWMDKSIISYKNSLKNDKYRFSPAKTIHMESVIDLQQLLIFGKDKQINIIGLLPPLSPNFYNSLISMNNRALFLKDFENKVNSIFLNHGFKCYNYSDISKYPELNIFKDDFYDKMHAKANLMEKIISDILSDMKNES